ncbi:uncharacterized protein VNE69_02215 [Vairimorpha necatrix]|uniref:Uncharacterized protein n=1 Tax=Vairimorpha necatrix TaxID=6039 RepID=A0AAX4J9M3_9MICR
MKILHLILPVLIYCTNEIMLNKITDNLLKKIYYRDYVVFNPYKIHIIVNLKYNESKKIIYIDIEEKASNAKTRIKDSCIIEYYDKTANDITFEIEQYIINILKYNFSCSINLIYDSLNSLTCLLIKEVIETIKNINSLRKVNKKGWDIYYDNICEANDFLLDVIDEFQKEKNNSEMYMSVFDVHTFYNTEHNELSIRLPMKIDGIYYLFELNIDQLDVEAFYLLNETNYVVTSPIFDDKIFMKLLIIFKSFNDDLIYMSKTPYIAKCKTSNYEIKNSDFKIKIDSDAASFKQRSGEYFYHLSNNASNSMYRNCFEEFQQLLKKISFFNNTKAKEGIDLFFRLLKRDDKIKYLFYGILDRKESAINLLCAHLFLSMNKIVHRDLNIIIGQDKHSKNEFKDIKNRLTKTIIPKLTDNNSFESYLIKICILIEAEKYINENDVTNDLLYNTIKEIGNILKLKNNNNNDKQFYYNQEGVDLAEIIHDVVNMHVDNILNHKGKVIRRLCTITSLLKEKSGTFTRNFLIYSKKDKTIDKLELNKNKVEKNIEILINEILKDIKEDKIYEKERKIKEVETNKIRKTLEKYCLIENLNAIFAEALDKDVTNIFEKDARIKFKYALMTKGIYKIVQVFKDHIIQNNNTASNYFRKMFKSNLNEETVNDYKKELIDKFKTGINIYIEENLINRSKMELYKILKALEENNFENGTIDKRKHEKKLLIYLEFLSKNDILEVLSDNPELKIDADTMKFINNNCKIEYN